MRRGVPAPVEAPERVVAVLLADGWHRVVPGSFTVGAFGFGVEDRPGFTFEEANEASPYAPATLAGPLDSVLAVRQVAPREQRPRPYAVDAARRSAVPATNSA
jgi:hypothetical protein